MVTVIGVRFKKAGKIYYFDPDNIDTENAKYVIVETARGVEFGNLVINKRKIQDDKIIAPLKKALRVATEEDIAIHEENQIKKKKAFEVCSEKIGVHDLDMKLIDVEYTFDNNKVIFYFTSDGRVDFRELVKDLASIFRTRIELRQIGVRDEAKMINGIGSCGFGLCCANWLGDFEPVSIKMAKDQNLSLNPSKISGICGRLMCCLKYEHEVYLELKKGMPKEGELVLTPKGKAIVVNTQTIREKVKVRLVTSEKNGELQLDDDVEVFSKTEVKRLNRTRKKPSDGEQNANKEQGQSTDSPKVSADTTKKPVRRERKPSYNKKAPVQRDKNKPNTKDSNKQQQKNQNRPTRKDLGKPNSNDNKAVNKPEEKGVKRVNQKDSKKPYTKNPNHSGKKPYTKRPNKPVTGTKPTTENKDN